MKKRRAKPAPPTPFVGIKIHPDILAKVRELAVIDYTTVSAVIRRFVVQGLAADRKDS